MSGDEVFITIVSTIIGLFFLCRWYAHLASLGRHAASGAFLSFIPVVLLGLLFVVLKTLASWDVRDSVVYLSMYMILGAGWLGLAMLLTPAMGISTRDDALERKNTAATFTSAGILFGFMACFAGGNIGDGPGWWVVYFSAALASVTLWLLWLILNLTTHIVDRITIDRDVGSGIRTAAFLSGAGLILGRAVAGDWVSASATVSDFVAVGWPVLILLAGAILFELFFKPNHRARRGCYFTEGILPALIFFLIAIVSVLAQGEIQ